MRGVGGRYVVALAGAEDERSIVTCNARGRFRNERVVPMVGDRVFVSRQAEDTYRLDEILPRTAEFVRPPVANIDRMVIVGSLAIPRSDPFLLDRMTAVCAHKGIQAVLCFNKNDLTPTETLADVYRGAGYPVVLTSAETGDGIDALRALLRGHVSAFTGNSGVGKTSLLRCLAPSLDLKTGEVSEKLGRGRHTTRHVELLTLPDGIIVADTPGFSSFDPDRMERLSRTEIERAFPEFAAYRDSCRFGDCLHIGATADNCAVLDALAREKIAKSRYDSYLKMLAQVKPQYA